MTMYVLGTLKTRLNGTFLLSTQSRSAFFFKTLRSGQVSLIYFAQAVWIIYAEDRAQMNSELNYLFFGKWKIGFLARQIGHGSKMRSLLFVGIQPIQAQQLMQTWAIYTVCIKTQLKVTTVHKITALSH